MKLLAAIQRDVFIDIKDNYNEALKYMNDHGAPFNLEYRTVDTRIKDMATYTQTIKDYDIVFLNYAPNLEKRHDCYTNPVRPGLVAGIIPCGIEEDTDKYNWLSLAIAHELMHAIAWTLETKFNIKTNVNQVMDTYYKNLDWDAPDGNFAQCWKILAPYMSLLWPNLKQNSPSETSFSQSAILTRTVRNREIEGTLTATNGGAVFVCKTLELPWINNKKSISCIPTGKYRCTFTRSVKFPKGTYQLMNVPNRTGIRIHKGNYAYKANGKPDIEGCILLGVTLADINNDGVNDITQSTVTVQAFERFFNKKDFTLVIK